MSEPKSLIANITPFGLRMQPDLKARIEEEAKSAGRSLNAEIVQRLEDSFEFSRVNERLAASAAIEESYELLRTSLRLSASLGVDFLSAIRAAADGNMDRFQTALDDVKRNPAKYETIEVSLKNLAGWANDRSEDERSET